MAPDPEPTEDEQAGDAEAEGEERDDALVDTTVAQRSDVITGMADDEDPADT